ncbi:bifunctional UDP-N-acetylglucosamine diphosphorylase/glucosamine-1-phosphate N-acetyltransferase GlmU [Ferrovibrio sp.]|uniref:bifunctional UDP-N-acetylglucosamine diphosphorylase/glucosamine-1-phosphate N-acetyltransferase GlmU n=1 Tax=Ferrovibrio sp. TaxID=1917215 RepID=UPI003D2E4782
MAKHSLAVIVLAAGQGTRMRSGLPKVLHPVAGLPMLRHVLNAAAALKPERKVLVLGRGMEAVAKAFAPIAVAVQDPPLGTGHAVQAAMPALKGFKGDVLVLYGDTPLLTADTLKKLVAARRSKTEPAVVVSGFRPADPAAYGRMIQDAKGNLDAIVEFKDCTPEQRAIGFCNGGMMLLDGARLPALLKKLDNNNAKGEYYLTDLVHLARAKGWACRAVEVSEIDVMGVNNRAELSIAEGHMQARLRLAALESGVTMTAPETVYLRVDTKLGRDVTIEPHVVFGPGVEIADNVIIRAFSHIEGARVASGATIGPYARLRPGAEIGADAHIGNFVEVKQARIEQGAKVNHLTYIGDARVGAKANIGAGTITCNYDGYSKHHTDIGANAFIGSNSALVAPVKVGDGALIAAGSTITQDVPADALALGRGRQETKPGLAARLRAQLAAQKLKAKSKK